MFEYGGVRNLCSFMSDVQIRAFFKTVLNENEPDPAAMLPSGKSLLLWVTNLLDGIPFCDSAQIALLLQELGPSIMEVGDALMAAAPGFDQQPPNLLIFADRRFVTFSGMTDFFDLTTGDMVPRLEKPTLETLSYSCTVMFVRNYKELESTDASTNADRGDAQPGA
jgi:hypothetical protein